MSVIDQNSAIISLDKALVPAPLLIDGRTEQDRLRFLSDFASLINFYDNDNRINGNWAPFLLKDPVFLLAYISKTPFSKFHSLYVNTCNRIEAIVNSKVIKSALVISLNRLFDQLIYIFMCIERWTYYMQRSDEEYHLKNYLLHEVKTNFSRYFWAIIALRESLSLLPGKSRIDPVNYYLFARYDKITWKQNKDKSPYWEILDVKNPITKNSPSDIYNALTRIGDKVFEFFQTIIQHSTAEFEKVKTQKSKYPDTTLLRVFVDLLKVHQDQLNEISQKHLNFYYQDILKQTACPAVADSVFIFAELAKNDAAFDLPYGTLFNAGPDAQKNTILFATQEETSLNPATITGAYTLAKVPGPDGVVKLCLQKIANPGVIQKDEDGKIQSWKTFGDSAMPGIITANPGIVIASPMLLLREGKRKIKLNINFSGKFDALLLKTASYYLSTQNSWLDVTTNVKPPTISTDQVKIEIILDVTQSSIEPFLIKPDGLDNTWPMLKIELSSLPDMNALPVFNEMTIKTHVLDVKNFQLYNDYGALSTKAPYQPFGPNPPVNSSFIIGSNEIFSKPLSSLSIKLQWNNLPDNFWLYYGEYNEYIARHLTPPYVQPKKKRSLLGRVIHSILKFVFNSSEVEYPPGDYFFNDCFTADFKLLQNGSWDEFEMIKKPADNENYNNDNQESGPQIQACENTNYLFTDLKYCIKKAVVETSKTMSDYSCFSYHPIYLNSSFAKPQIADPTIQLSQLKYADTSISGFMKIVLGGNPQGFGSGLYPNVVSQIALYNSWALYNNKPDNLVSPANLPFSPKLTGFVANYHASQRYDAATKSTDYPIQCFVCTPFINYLIYDNSKQTTTITNDQINNTEAKPAYNLSSFPSFSYDGFLFLEMDNLVPSNSINLYFELTRSHVTNTTSKNTWGYYYLNNKGWQTLPVLADGTNNFSCSGILKVNVPGDITNQSMLMPGSKYWFCIAVQGDPALAADIVFLKTNGIVAQRVGDSYLTNNQAPQLPANIITKPQTAIPQIAVITQPLPSFGGKATESYSMTNQRVSNRLKTKDRAITAEDFFRLIRQEYNDVYYSKAVFYKQTKTTAIYVVRAYENYTDASAFTPLLSECKVEKIQAFLQGRVSGFSNIRVSNFDLYPVNITATVVLKPAFTYQQAQIQKNIKHALNIFISPWIASSDPQIMIDQGISNSDLVKFIKSIEGVADVQSVSFLPVYDGKEFTDASLIISGMDHHISIM